jgi:hypothetical protein
MLNVYVYKHNGSSHTRTMFKDSSLSIPLGPDNCHPQHVHLWPPGCMRGILRLCSRAADQVEVGETFLSRFVQHGSSRALINFSQHVIHNTINAPRRLAEKKSVIRNSGVFWIVLPYHPLWWQSGLHYHILKYLNSVPSKCALAAAGLSNVSNRDSWKNILKPAMHVLTNEC